MQLSHTSYSLQPLQYFAHSASPANLNSANDPEYSKKGKSVGLLH